MTSEHDITELLHTYERSLNDSDPDLAASCYARDGVFMPTTHPTATAEGIRAAYAQIFSAIQLRVTFTIDELVIAIAWTAQHRLHARYRSLTARGKSKQSAVTAVGRELLGFIWAIGMAVETKRHDAGPVAA